MVFKLKAVLLSLISAVGVFIFILWATKLTIPLPADALKISEKTDNFGPVKSVTRFYQSSWTPVQVEAFYKKEMLPAGWRDAKDGVFTKDNQILIVTVDPLKDAEGKINFSNTISKIPPKEKLFSLRKKKPKKLNFMPIYPGSVQVFLWDSPLGAASSYETKSSIKEVVFFYKSGMLNYGWSLDSETPLKEGVIDCPGCRQASPGAFDLANAKSANTESINRLIFSRKNGETCSITIAPASSNPGNLPIMGKSNNAKNLSLPGKTIILVDYRAYQRIK